MKNSILKVSFSLIVISSLLACSKSDYLEPNEEIRINGSIDDSLQKKKPGWAFFGISIYFGESTLNPHYDPETPASSSNPLTICLGQGWCKITVGEAAGGGDAVVYPRKTDSDKLEFYFDSSEMSSAHLENFENNQFIVHEDIELNGDWLVELGFSDGKYSIEKGSYEVKIIGDYLIVVF